MGHLGGSSGGFTIVTGVLHVGGKTRKRRDEMELLARCSAANYKCVTGDDSQWC